MIDRRVFVAGSLSLLATPRFTLGLVRGLGNQVVVTLVSGRGARRVVSAGPPLELEVADAGRQTKLP
jgi:hypothetical protein